MGFGRREDVVEEFNKLTQERGRGKYDEKFEELKSLISILNSSLAKSYYVSSFINGLIDDIKPMFKILKPTALVHMFDQTNNQIVLWKGRIR